MAMFVFSDVSSITRQANAQHSAESGAKPSTTSIGHAKMTKDTMGIDISKDSFGLAVMWSTLWNVPG
jgi:hypothetical protein